MFRPASWLGWQDANNPNLNGQALFDPNRPIRWLLNETPERIINPTAFVEMQGGDRLPGRVISWHDADGRGPDRLPAYLTVKVDIPVDMPDHPQRPEIRVRAANLRRVVWQRRGSDVYTPGTLFYVDGRRAAFRSAR